jgi:hypothetical protein
VNAMTGGKGPVPPTCQNVAQRRRPGLPDPAAIVGVHELRSPKGTLYRVIRTRERDTYDKPDEPPDDLDKPR